MSWAKIDDRANEHEKHIAAGPKACWLWACGLMYANRQPRKTGRVPKAVVQMLYPGMSRRDADKLVNVGLWHDDGDAYLIHDYQAWNPELREKRSEAGRKGGQKSGEARREAKTKQVASGNGSKNEASASSTPPRARVRALDPPHPTPQEDPPLPPRERPADPFGDSLRGVAPGSRADVAQLFDAFKLAVQLPGLKFRGSHDLQATQLAEAIDVNGFDDCMLVAAEAPNDRMVSGEADERGMPHKSVGYVFGNATAFARILAAAKARHGARSRVGIDAGMAAAMAANPEDDDAA